MADSATTEVSWQSLFWALIPIALNSMTQPCGQIYGFSEEYGFFLRSSPIICAYDTITTFVLLGCHLNEERSFQKALQGVISYRFRQTNREVGNGVLQDLQNNTRLRLFLFAAGALPQLIKIYAFAGVHWTKAWASLYLVSFGLFEILVILQRKPLIPLPIVRSGHSNGNQAIIRKVHNLSFNLALFFSCIFSFVVFVQSINKGPDLTWFAGAYISFITLLVVQNITFDEEFRDVIQASLMAFIQIFLLLHGHPTFIESDKIINLLYFICGYYIFACFYIPPKRFWAWVRREHSSIYLFLNTTSKIYIVLLNFSIGLICYSLLYDPAGTVKPKWTENLG